MNYAEARQRKDDLRWDWTNMNDKRVWPVGYCAGWRDWTEDMAKRIGMSLEDIKRRQDTEDGPTKGKFHGDGHATKEEAERCFYEYSLDRVQQASLKGTQKVCQFPGCGDWTSHALESPGMDGLFPPTMLCHAHRNREGLMQVHPFQGGIQLIHS